MPCLSRVSRIMLASLLLSAAAWVALPVLKVFTREADEVPAGASEAVVAGRGRSAAPRHVIRDPVPEPGPSNAADPPQIPQAGNIAAIPAGIPPHAPPDRWAPTVTPLPQAVAVVPPDTAPIPPLPQAFSARPPALDATYRSTLEIPPPPLLDANAAPPVSLSEAKPEFLDRAVSGDRGGGIPGEYVIRDGDDLTSIAVRFYGNPAAAEAIWAANRDRLPDPKLLPIGRALHLPPMNAAGLPTGRRERLIEPL